MKLKQKEVMLYVTNIAGRYKKEEQSKKQKGKKGGET